MPQYVSLQEIMDQARQRADQVNSVFVAEAELILAVNASAKKLHDLLVSAYGDEYFFETFTDNFTVDQANYPVPANLYKLVGIDIETGTGSNRFFTVDRYTNKERNRDVTFSYTGLLLEYRLRGGNIVFAPAPKDTRQFKINYTPTARKLIKQTFVPADVNAGTDTLTLTAHGLLNDAPIQFSSDGTLPAGLSSNVVYFASAVTADTLQVSASIGGAALDITDTGAAESTHTLLSAFDGINGYEDYMVVDVARKMLDKEESDSRPFIAEKERIIFELEQISKHRDSGEPEQMTDVDPFTLVSDFPLRWPPPL